MFLPKTALEKSAETFNCGSKDSLNVTIVQETEKRPDKVFRANVICDGEPSRIYVKRIPARTQGNGE